MRKKSQVYFFSYFNDTIPKTENLLVSKKKNHFGIINSHENFLSNTFLKKPPIHSNSPKVIVSKIVFSLQDSLLKEKTQDSLQIEDLFGEDPDSLITSISKKEADSIQKTIFPPSNMDQLFYNYFYRLDTVKIDTLQNTIVQDSVKKEKGFFAFLKRLFQKKKKDLTPKDTTFEEENREEELYNDLLKDIKIKTPD